MKKVKFLIILLTIGNIIYSQEIRIWPEITGLAEFAFPEMESANWRALNSSREKYYINDIGEVNITNQRIKKPIFLEVDNGEIIGINNGEWGGKLVFKNNDCEYDIINENVCGIFKYKNEIYILTGLAHGWSQYGKIIKLKIIDNKYTIDYVIEIDKEPQTFKIYNDIVYILTFDGLITFDGNNVVELFREQNWAHLTSYSTLFISDKIIGIGLWGCIVIIENNNIKAYKR
ncbi:hypothetical protein AGMMS49579_25360 [Spirochaetia bacterium]|nr:hypothetical protein AGMMS49579_25360 [Spirochaetia bacterium]